MQSNVIVLVSRSGSQQQLNQGVIDLILLAGHYLFLIESNFAANYVAYLVPVFNLVHEKNWLVCHILLNWFILWRKIIFKLCNSNVVCISTL